MAWESCQFLFSEEIVETEETLFLIKKNIYIYIYIYISDSPDEVVA